MADREYFRAAGIAILICAAAFVAGLLFVWAVWR